MSVEKKHSGSTTDCCGKTFRAVTTCSRSPSRASPTSSPTTMNPSVKATDIQTKPVLPPRPKLEQHKTPNKKVVTDSVAVDLDYTTPPSEKSKSKLADHAKTPGEQQGLGPKMEKPMKTDSSVEGNRKPKAPISGEVNKHEGKKPGIHIEDRFSDYINRAKLKIRSMTNVGEGKKLDKTFSEYINHAKGKIRAMSSAGNGKHDSYK